MSNYSIELGPTIRIEDGKLKITRPENVPDDAIPFLNNKGELEFSTNKTIENVQSVPADDQEANAIVYALIFG